MATFYNQAQLSYNGQITNSNITEGELLEQLTLTKTSVSGSYGVNDTVAFAVNLVNTGSTALTSLTLTDNLGAYAVGTGSVVPLDYVDGSLSFYLNGTLETAPTVEAGPPLTVSGINIPAGANALFLYEARTNSFAPTAEGASITNTVTATGGGLAEALSSSAVINAEFEAHLTIAKAICPATVTDNGELTYTFIIQNTGNRAIVATDNVTVTDAFNPILNPINVSFNGVAWQEGTNYTYSDTTGLFTTLDGQITVPAASYTQDPTTGIITVTPGVSIITVTGTV